MSLSNLQSRLQGAPTPKLNNWGADSEYGVLRDVLVGPIGQYSWQEGNATSRKYIREGAEFDHSIAVAQYNEMISAYQEAGVITHILPEAENLPYQIYARDSSVMTPWGPIISQMYSPWRRGEYKPVLEFYLSNDIPIFDCVTAGTFEGGDFMMIEPGALLIGSSGERTSEAGAMQVKTWFEQQGWEVKIGTFDPFFLHMDVMCVMLAEKLAAVCLDVIPDDVLDWLRERKIKVLDVPFKQAMDLGCNVVALGKDRVLLPKESTTLKELCQAEGLTVLDPDISMITKGGGGVHCMCQPLRRD